MIVALGNKLQDLMDAIRKLDFLAPLALRLYLIPVFFIAGRNKWNPLDSDSSLQGTIDWFANPDWGLGLPAPALLAFLAWSAEYIGAILLAIGFAVRWITIPMMFTMIVAMTTVHWDNGWQAVHDAQSPYPAADIVEVNERKDRARAILREHGNYNYLKERGNFVISNNGIEWAATYFIMLLALWALGGGRYVSADHWIRRRFRTPSSQE